MINTIFSWVWSISAILLVASILLHNPKGDGMGGLAASGSSMFTSASSAENSLNRISWTLIGIFLSLAIVLSAGWAN
uniref:Probable protein-export membrane protein SecG n=1 Tax=Paulinella longichromatophora TaxID=1708747 RepID=A0A2H4ZNK5_9EUKA|nr:preprotein translocase, SecG subunit [Paulinella longichromatophora]